jgi:shikimate kinase
MNNKRIFLTGFMTSGKSTLGPILANVLGFSYLDLDYEIEKTEEKSIDEIFKVNGEEYFREIETKNLLKFGQVDNCVISLGGGTIMFNHNLSFIKKNGILIYLKSSPEAIYNRIKNKLDRPLFKDLVEQKKPKEEFIKRISNMLSERESYYKQANLTVSTDNHNIGPTIDFIANKIQKIKK